MNDDELAAFRANDDPEYYPDHIALVAHIDAQAAEIARLRAALKEDR